MARKKQTQDMEGSAVSQGRGGVQKRTPRAKKKAIGEAHEPTAGGKKRAPAKKKAAPVKQQLSTGDCEKLVAVIASLKRLGSSYPLTVRDLLKLADLPWPGEAALVDRAVSKHLLLTAAQNVKRPAMEEALVFLPEDLPRLVTFAPTLRHLIERYFERTKSKSDSCSVAALLKAGLNGKVADALRRQLKDRIDARRLPEGIGALRVRGAYQLFLFDRIVGTPATVSSEPKLRQTASSVPAESISSTNGHGATPVASDTQRAEAPELSSRVQAAFDVLDAKSGSNNQVLLYDLRREVDVSREVFDGCIEALRYERVFTLSCEEGRFGRLPAEAVEGGIPGTSGRFVYIARR